MAFEKNLGASQCLISNPCNPATGNKYQAEEDYRNGDGTLTFTRTYNSQQNQGFGTGFNWSSPHHKILAISGSPVQVRRGTGYAEPFTCPSSGACQGDPDTKLRLSKDASGYTLTLRDNATERYDLSGKLLSTTDSASRNTSYGYDTNGRVASVTGPFGLSLTFGYNANNRISTVTEPDPSRMIYYDYDDSFPAPVPATPAGNLTRVRYPDGTAKLYHYNEAGLTGGANLPNHLTGISYVDAQATVTRYSSYAYDSTGRAIRTEHAQTDNGGPQERFTFNYDSATQTTVTDPIGTQEVMNFATNLGVKNLTNKVNQSDGKSVQQVFDGNNNLTCKKDEENRVITSTFNSTNQKLSMTEGLTGDCANPVTVPGVTRTTSYTYLSPNLDLPTQVTAPSVAGTGYSKTTTIQYTDTSHPNLPTAITQSGFTPAGTAVSRTVTLGYNASGQVNSINGPRTDVTDVTTLEYYECTTGGACGQLMRVTNALGHVTTYDLYDANGRLKQMTDPNGLRTSYTYDARGRVVTITRTTNTEVAATTQYSYTAWGGVSQVIDPDGVVLNYQYDAAHDLRFVMDAAGNSIHYKYDLKGNRTGEDIYDAGGNLKRAVTQTYDLRNHLDTITSAGNMTRLVHDAVGNLLSESPNADGVNRTKTHEYDALNRLFQTMDAVNGANTPTGYGYDANDRAALVTPPGKSGTRYTYDDLGNLRSESSPDRGTTTYTYDAAGNTLTVRDGRNITTTYAYDALNRLVSQQSTDPATPGYTYQYDYCGRGRWCGVQQNGAPHLQYAYDGLGRVSYVLDANWLAVLYAYSPAGRLLRITYPFNGPAVDYAYDAAGRVSQVSAVQGGVTVPLARNIQYHPFGPVSGLTYGNGLALTAYLDAAYRPTWRIDGPLFENRYGYDAADNPTARYLSTLGSESLGYDALSRLTGAQSTAGYGNLSYLYDANGNRSSETRNGTAVSYYYSPAGSNWLSFTGNEIRLRDAAGNLSYAGLLGSLTYDGYGRLTGVAGASYGYNVLNQRIKKTVGGGSTAFVYGPRGELLYELTDDGIGRAHMYLEGAPLARLTGSTVLYYHIDSLGTPQLMTNSVGTAVWKASYEPFGKTTVNEDPDGNGVLVKNNMRYAGQYFDQETGLHYNWHRYYDPKVGRYISSDPIGLAGGLNTYAYVGNNPLRWIDPTGLATTVTVWQPVGWGQSSFGHVSTDINGTTYSFGPSGMSVLSTSDYLSRNAFRSGVGAKLNLNPQQETRLQSCMSKSRSSFNTVTNNCGTPIQDCLNELGYDLGWNLFPVSVGNSLLDYPGLVTGFDFYSATQPATGTSAPWAR